MKTAKRKFRKLGVIGRFKPLHNGAYSMLETLCENTEQLIVGIGSSNKYNLRNPFTPEESEAMINSALADRFSNYKIVHVPDFAHIPKYADGKKWRNFVIEKFGDLDAFVTSNEYIRNLLGERYEIVHPTILIPKEKQIKLRATEVRFRIASYNDSWKDLVPKKVADYLEKEKLVDRFREDFGLQTMAYIASGHNFDFTEKAEAEMLHAQEV